MFRLTHHMQDLIAPAPVDPIHGPARPVVTWNLTRRCNLHCRHCPTASADLAFPGELDHAQAMAVLQDLKDFGIPALILSGGEPLCRFDFFDLAARARDLGFGRLELSTNGTLLARNIHRIAALGFDRVGISLDGIGGTNDLLRGVEGAFAAALAGLRACKAAGVRVGLRFTLTQANASFLPDLLGLCQDEGADSFHLLHPVHAGRSEMDRDTTRRAMDQVIARAWTALTKGPALEIATGNNDADAAYVLAWAARTFKADAVARLRARLEANAAGLAEATIDPQGKVHPGCCGSGYSIGNVKREPFSALWSSDDPVLAALRTRPQPLKGRCGACALQAVCGGGTRLRALQQTGDLWAEDPACALSNPEIGLPGAARPDALLFCEKGHDPAHLHL